MVLSIVNGELVEDPQISVLNKANFFAFSVYESVRVTKRNIHFLNDHVDRLFDSAKMIGLEHNFSKEEIKKWTELLVSKIEKEDCLLRFQLFGADDASDVLLYIFPVGITFYPDKYYSNGVKVITYEYERLLPKAKTNNLLGSYIALRGAYKQDALEALLVNVNGEVLEGTRTNFYAIKEGILYTNDCDVLDGVTRKHLLKVAEGIVKGIKFVSIKLSDIKKGLYDEYFISSSTMGIMPINQIDDQKICEKSGEYTRKLMKAVKKSN